MKRIKVQPKRIMKRGEIVKKGGFYATFTVGKIIITMPLLSTNQLDYVSPPHTILNALLEYRN